MRSRANPFIFFSFLFLEGGGVGVGGELCPVTGWICISFFHCFSSFNCCLNVVLWLDEGDYPENVHAVFCPNKQLYSEPFMCFDLVLECYQSFFVTLSPYRLHLRVNCISRVFKRTGIQSWCSCDRIFITDQNNQKDDYSWLFWEEKEVRSHMVTSTQPRHHSYHKTLYFLR